jgi:hypothetical protein
MVIREVEMHFYVVAEKGPVAMFGDHGDEELLAHGTP